MLTAIRLTSWGELFCKGYTGRDCMGRMLASIKSQVDAKTLGQDEFLKVHVPSGEPAGLSLPWLEDHVLQSLAGPKAGPAAPPRERA